MAEPTDPNVLQEMIKEWKRQNKEKPRDLDYEMLDVIMRHVNGSSPVKVARNPLDKERDWIPDTVCQNVKSVSIDDQGRLTVHVRGDKTELSVDAMLGQIKRLKTKISRSSSIMLKISDKKTVQLTDIYSHALVKDSWAGLPFDLVLAYYEEDPTDEKDSTADSADDSE